MTTPKSIIVYSTTWCPDCRRTKQFLDQREIPYTWIDIDKDPAAVQEVLRINGGMRSVPTLVFPDGSVLVEPSNKQLGEKLSTHERPDEGREGEVRTRPVEVTVYRMTGSQLFFRVPEAVCEECDLTVAVAHRVAESFGPERVTVTVKPWLNHLPEALLKGGWHPPVVTVDGRLVTQGIVPTSETLERAIKEPARRDRTPV
ncbi:MAG: glutathione S-transferase N-terminal domain-containing protein [Chloroflexi bacterium]|nr:glutathione S-transferase N-terminal domain-containing protein [Chloroflexota bacterium]